MADVLHQMAVLLLLPLFLLLLPLLLLLLPRFSAGYYQSHSFLLQPGPPAWAHALV